MNSDEAFWAMIGSLGTVYLIMIGLWLAVGHL